MPVLWGLHCIWQPSCRFFEIVVLFKNGANEKECLKAHQWNGLFQRAYSEQSMHCQKWNNLWLILAILPPCPWLLAPERVPICGVKFKWTGGPHSPMQQIYWSCRRNLWPIKSIVPDFEKWQFPKPICLVLSPSPCPWHLLVSVSACTFHFLDHIPGGKKESV